MREQRFAGQCAEAPPYPWSLSPRPPVRVKVHYVTCGFILKRRHPQASNLYRFVLTKKALGMKLSSAPFLQVAGAGKFTVRWGEATSVSEGAGPLTYCPPKPTTLCDWSAGDFGGDGVSLGATRDGADQTRLGAGCVKSSSDLLPARAQRRGLAPALDALIHRGQTAPAARPARRTDRLNLRYFQQPVQMAQRLWTSGEQMQWSMCWHSRMMRNEQLFKHLIGNHGKNR